ncbi:MAG: alcohol dehydrogenase catalytic domain-containing protein [Nocardioides sp.]
MRAVQVVERGLGLDGLALADRPAPEPGPGEVLLEVAAVSASRLDLLMVNGTTFGPDVVLPRTLGGDPAGRIAAVGPGVEPQRVGERVVVKPNIFCGTCAWCSSGREADCRAQTVLGLHRDGGAADLVVVPARSAFVVPGGVSATTAAAAVHTVPVALHMLRVAGGVEPGRVVVVTGAAGAVGSAAVQLVTALGGRAVAVVQDSEQAAFVAGLAIAGVVRLDRESLADGVRRLVPAGADVAVDTTGVPDVLGACVDALAWGGHAVTCSGAPTAVAQVNLSDLYRLRRSLHGSAASDVADVREALALVASGQVRPQLGVVVPLAEYRAAYGAVLDPARNGKVVMEVNQ